MENPEVQSQQIPTPGLSLPSLIDTGASRQIPGLEKFIAPPLKGAPVSFDSLSEIMKNNPAFDMNQVMSIVNSFKSINAEKQMQIGSLLGSRSNNPNIEGMSFTVPPLNLKSLEEDTKMEEDEDDDGLEASDDDLELSPELENRKNLLDNVKENLDSILQADGGKKRFTEKRWWTPEEVFNWQFFV